MRRHVNPHLHAYPGTGLEPELNRGELRLLAEVDLAREEGKAVPANVRQRVHDTAFVLAR